jgi:hypothetical protein
MAGQKRPEMPKPPRYFLGFLRDMRGKKLNVFHDAIMYPLSQYEMRIVNRDPHDPFAGEISPRLQGMRYGGVEISEIQYAIACLDRNEKYRIEIFKHPFKIPALLVDMPLRLVSPNRKPLMKLYPASWIFDGIKSGQRPIQFVL